MGYISDVGYISISDIPNVGYICHYRGSQCADYGWAEPSTHRGSKRAIPVCQMPLAAGWCGVYGLAKQREMSKQQGGSSAPFAQDESPPCSVLVKNLLGRYKASQLNGEQVPREQPQGSGAGAGTFSAARGYRCSQPCYHIMLSVSAKL